MKFEQGPDVHFIIFVAYSTSKDNITIERIVEPFINKGSFTTRDSLSWLSREMRLRIADIYIKECMTRSRSLPSVL
jgi:hypothetical protein